MSKPTGTLPEGTTEPTICSQCGQAFDAPACGPTHALIARYGFAAAVAPSPLPTPTLDTLLEARMRCNPSRCGLDAVLADIPSGEQTPTETDEEAFAKWDRERFGGGMGRQRDRRKETFLAGAAHARRSAQPACSRCGQPWPTHPLKPCVAHLTARTTKESV